MALIVILICLGVQRYMQFSSYAYQLNWVEPYYIWVVSQFEQMFTSYGFVGLVILVVPILVLVSIVFALFYHLFGIVAYFLLNLVLFWYCVDARYFKNISYPATETNGIFVHTYQNLFAIIFWFTLLGPVGLSLYFTVLKLREYLEKHVDEKNRILLEITQKTQGVLDWVPIRLLGLSFALVGHFTTVFKIWLSELLTGIKTDCQQVARWGDCALQTEDKNEAIALVDRALLVWLVAIALLYIGFWLG